MKQLLVSCLGNFLRRTPFNVLLGLLTFCLYYLIKHPEAMRKAREEIDEVLGDQQIQLTDISKLKYIEGMTRFCAGASSRLN